MNSYTIAASALQAPVKLWFCLRTQPKHEHIAAARLREMEGVEVFCPRIRVRRRTRRGPVWFVEPMFPGYLFAKFDLVQSHRQIRYSPGITGILQFADRFATVDESLIRELQQGIGPSETVSMDYALSEGETVKIAEGAFQGLEAVVTSIMPGRERVRVLLEFLGRKVEAELKEGSVLPQAIHPMAI